LRSNQLNYAPRARASYAFACIVIRSCQSIRNELSLSVTAAWNTASNRGDSVFYPRSLAYSSRGRPPAVALRNSLDLARHAESLGLQTVLAGRTSQHARHRQRSHVCRHRPRRWRHQDHPCRRPADIMLPNHSPLVIAEQFGTLASLYPDRIDLGLGRAPGTDQPTARALRRNIASTSDNFPQDVEELQSYFEPHAPNQRIHAVPGSGLRVPIWLLGSSLFSAQLAAELGLPFAFASHFAPRGHDAGFAALSHTLQAIAATRPPLRHAGPERDRRRNERPGALSFHFGPASLHKSSTRHPRPDSATHRRHRFVLVTRRESLRQHDPLVLSRGFSEYRGTQLCSNSSKSRSPTRSSQLRTSMIMERASAPSNSWGKFVSGLCRPSYNTLHLRIP